MGFFANVTLHEMHTGIPFECRRCVDLNRDRTSAEMTNCSTLNVTLDRIPVRAGYWRQNPRSTIVRLCDYDDACLGGAVAGDASCSPGHRGPLCDICLREPLYYGGRGQGCVLCSDIGDPRLTIGVAVGTFVTLLLLLVLLLILVRKRTDKVLQTVQTTIMRQSTMRSGVATSPGSASLTTKTGVRDSSRLMGKAKILVSLGQTLVKAAPGVAVKAKILISMAQVGSQIGRAYSITYPPIYAEVLRVAASINIPINVLPFGCVFPDVDNFYFELVLTTTVPLVFVLALMAIAKCLRQYATRASPGKSDIILVVADILSDIWFFTVFLVYPGCSTRIFTFFMREEYGMGADAGLGEEQASVMLADRSLSLDSGQHSTFFIFAVVMFVIYPLGVPCLYAAMLLRSRHELHELRRIELVVETNYQLAKLDASGRDKDEAERVMRKAREGYETSVDAMHEQLRAQLPTALRRLTAGYELRY